MGFWDFITVDLVVASTAVVALFLSVYNTWTQVSESKEKISLKLEEFDDETDSGIYRNIRCVFHNKGKNNVNSVKISLVLCSPKGDIELREIKMLSPYLKDDSTRIGAINIPANDIRVLFFKPQNVVQELINNEVVERKIKLIVKLENHLGKEYNSNILKLNLSDIDPFDDQANKKKFSK